MLFFNKDLIIRNIIGQNSPLMRLEILYKHTTEIRDTLYLLGLGWDGFRVLLHVLEFIRLSVNVYVIVRGKSVYCQILNYLESLSFFFFYQFDGIPWRCSWDMFVVWLPHLSASSNLWLRGCHTMCWLPPEHRMAEEDLTQLVQLTWGHLLVNTLYCISMELIKARYHWIVRDDTFKLTAVFLDILFHEIIVIAMMCKIHVQLYCCLVVVIKNLICIMLYLCRQLGGYVFICSWFQITDNVKLWRFIQPVRSII